MAKMTLIIILAALTGFALLSCGKSADKEAGNLNDQVRDKQPQKEKEISMLVAYFSKTGNTRAVANLIWEKTGSDLFEIKPEKKYPADYNENVKQAKKELESNSRPALADTLDGIEDYDIIFIGYPIWWGTMPMPVLTFLEKYDWKGKTLVPFCTHEGSGLGTSVQDLKKLCPDAKILEGLAIRGSQARISQKEVEDWLQKNSLIR